MRKTILLLLITFAFSGISKGQIGVRIYDYRPTGDLGSQIKPLINVEFGYIPFFESRVRPVIMFTFMNCKPRLDVFPVTGATNNSAGDFTVYPGTMSYTKFQQFQIHGGIDFAFIKRKKFSMFMGANLLFGLMYVQYNDQIPGVIDEVRSEDGGEFGFQARLGAQYNITKHIGIFASANRDFFLLHGASLSGLLWANDYGIGVIYSFQK